MHLSKPQMFKQEMTTQDDDKSNGGGEPACDAYKIAIACSVADDAYVYTFTTRGPADAARMYRALYYYDHTLFREQIHRDKLLNAVPRSDDAPRIARQYDPARASGALHESIVAAYKFIQEHFAASNGGSAEVVMRIASVSTVVEKNVLVQSRTLAQPAALRKIDALPEPIDYTGIGLCLVCSRVVSVEADGKQLCSRCDLAK